MHAGKAACLDKREVFSNPARFPPGKPAIRSHVKRATAREMPPQKLHGLGKTGGVVFPPHAPERVVAAALKHDR
jgi:hypothetical protein